MDEIMQQAQEILQDKVEKDNTDRVIKEIGRVFKKVGEDEEYTNEFIKGYVLISAYLEEKSPTKEQCMTAISNSISCIDSEAGDKKKIRAICIINLTAEYMEMNFNDELIEVEEEK